MSATNSLITVETTMGELPWWLKDAYRTKNPIFLHGPPGIGKSDGVNEFCAQMHAKGVFKRKKPIDLRLAQHESTDFKFPITIRRPAPKDDPAWEQAILRWIVAEVLPQEERDGPNGLLFLDELSSAIPQMQTLAYSLLLDRKLPSTDYELPPGWVVVAAGNRDTDQAVVHKLSSALCNRVNHVDIKPDWPAFKAWWEEKKLNTYILGFLSHRHNDYLYSYTRGQKAYPTPRSWYKFSQSLDGLIEDKEPLHRIRAMAQSWVGVQAGTEFAGYYDQALSIPKAEDVLRGKAKLPSIDKIGHLFMLGQSISDLVREQPAQYAASFLKLLLTDFHEDIAVECLRRVLTNSSENPNIMKAFLADSKLFKQVSEKYRDAIKQLATD